jgi:hypothetical protein
VNLVTGLAILLLPIATSASASAQMSVTALPNRTLVPTDTTFHISGSVVSTTTPLVARLQQLVKKTWNYVGVARTSATGAYVIYIKETQVGTDTLRVVIFKSPAMPSPTTAHLAISSTFKVTVAAWTYLSNWNMVEGQADNTGQVQINGVSYSNSLSFDNYNSDPNQVVVGYNLNRHCYSLTGVLGLDDSDRAGYYGEFTVLTDGKTVLDTTVSFGQTNQMNLNVSGVLRLELGTNFNFPNNSGYLMDWASLKVLCSF